MMRGDVEFGSTPLEDEGNMNVIKTKEVHQDQRSTINDTTTTNHRSTRDDDDDGDDPQDFLHSGRFYGDETFHPQFIITQILVLQSAYYVCLSGVILLTFGVMGYSRSLKVLFSSESFSPHHSASGVLLDILVLLTAIPTAFCVAPVVERTKKCLDFSSTIYINHVILCSFIHGLPTGWSFWITHVLATAITTLIAESLCSKSEMQEIVLNKKLSRTPNKKPTVGYSSATAAASTTSTLLSKSQRMESSSARGSSAPTSAATATSSSLSTDIASSTLSTALPSHDTSTIIGSNRVYHSTELSVIQKPRALTIGKPPPPFSLPSTSSSSPNPQDQLQSSIPFSSSPLMSSTVFLPLSFNNP